jgi:hypothetical protein
VTPPTIAELLTREELLTTSEGRIALRAWEAGDHSALLAEERARAARELD